MIFDIIVSVLLSMNFGLFLSLCYLPKEFCYLRRKVDTLNKVIDENQNDFLLKETLRDLKENGYDIPDQASDDGRHYYLHSIERSNIRTKGSINEKYALYKAPVCHSITNYEKDINIEHYELKINIENFRREKQTDDIKNPEIKIT